METIEGEDEGAVESVVDVVEESEPVNTVKSVNNSGTPIEIIRNDIDESKTEQLNLF